MMEVLKTVMTQNYLFNQSIKVLAQTDTSILRKYNSACHKGVQLIYIPSVTFTFYNLIFFQFDSGSLLSFEACSAFTQTGLYNVPFFIHLVGTVSSYSLFPSNHTALD